MSAKEKRSQDTNWDKRESPVKFIAQILVAGVVLSGIYFWYKGNVESNEKAGALAKEAHGLLLKGNPSDLQKAKAKLEEAIQIKPSHGYSLASLAELNAILWGEQKVQGTKDDAARYLGLAEQHAANLSQTYSAKALLMVFEGKGKEAEDFLFTNVIDKDAGDGRILAAYGQALRAQGKLEEARRSFRAAFDSDWRDPRFAQLIGDSYLETGDAANALNYYQRGTSANSEHLGAQLGVLRARIARGDIPKDAADQIKGVKEAETSPRNRALALVAEAELALAGGDVDQALATAEEAAKADSTYAWSYSILAAAKARKGDIAGAATDYDKAVEADAFIGAFYFDAAATLAQAGQGDQAVAFVEKYPLKKDDRYLVAFGNVFRSLGRLEEALGKYEEAIKANETNADAYLFKGTILIGQKKFDEAKDTLDRAVAARQFYPEVYAQRAQLLFEQKKYEDGLQEYVTALQQWKQSRWPTDRLMNVIEEVKQQLVRMGQRDYAKAWESEAPSFIR